MEEEEKLGSDDRDPEEDKRQKHLMDIEEQKAIIFLKRLGYEIKKLTKYDR